MAKHFTKSWSLQLKLVIFLKKLKSWSYFGAKIAQKVPKLLPKGALCLNSVNACQIWLRYSKYLILPYLTNLGI